MAMKHYGDSYDDKMDEVMNFADQLVTSKDKRIKIRSKEDLREVFKMIDRDRRRQGLKPAFPVDKRTGRSAFADRVIPTPHAGSFIGRILGKFHKGSTVQVFRTANPEGVSSVSQAREKAIVDKYKAEGKAVYRYPGGLAVKSALHRKKAGKVILPEGGGAYFPEPPKVSYRFRNAENGRLLAKNLDYQEIE